MSFRYFVLGLLTQQSMSGYDIKNCLENLAWLIGSPSFGSLYPALHALLEDGLATVEVVRDEGKPMRKLYTITEVGLEELGRWLEQPPEPDTSLKTFLMRLMLARRLSHPWLAEHLERRRDQVAAEYASLEEMAGMQEGAGCLGQHLAQNYGLAVARAELDWLNATLEQLSEPEQQLSLGKVQEDATLPIR